MQTSRLPSVAKQDLSLGFPLPAPSQDKGQSFSHAVEKVAQKFQTSHKKSVHAKPSRPVPENAQTLPGPKTRPALRKENGPRDAAPQDKGTRTPANRIPQHQERAPETAVHEDTGATPREPHLPKPPATRAKASAAAREQGSTPAEHAAKTEAPAPESLPPSEWAQVATWSREALCDEPVLLESAVGTLTEATNGLTGVNAQPASDGLPVDPGAAGEPQMPASSLPDGWSGDETAVDGMGRDDRADASPSTQAPGSATSMLLATADESDKQPAVVSNPTAQAQAAPSPSPTTLGNGAGESPSRPIPTASAPERQLSDPANAAAPNRIEAKAPIEFAESQADPTASTEGTNPTGMSAPTSTAGALFAQTRQDIAFKTWTAHEDPRQTETASTPATEPLSAHPESLRLMHPETEPEIVIEGQDENGGALESAPTRARQGEPSGTPRLTDAGHESLALSAPSSSGSSLTGDGQGSSQGQAFHLGHTGLNGIKWANAGSETAAQASWTAFQGDAPASGHSAQARLHEIQAMLKREMDAKVASLRQIGTEEIQLQLSPEHLGKLKVSLEVREGAVTAHIQVQSEAARQAVDQGMQQLRDNLSQHGLRIENLSVSVDDKHSGLFNPDGRGGETFFANRHGHSAEDGEGFADATDEPAMRKLGYNTLEITA